MDRDKRLDAIRAHADKLDAVAKGYRRLVMAAERETSTDALLSLVEVAGRLSCSNLSQLATTLELLYDAGERTNPSEETPQHLRGGFVRLTYEP